MPGPSPEPTALKLLKGNPGRRPLNHEEPQPESGIPDCPTWLKGEARAEWKRVTKQLEVMGCISQADRSVLAAYCQCWADFVWAVKQLEEVGSLTVQMGCQTHPHPALVIRRHAEQMLLKFAQDFGLTPSARSRIKIAKKNPKETGVRSRNRDLNAG